MASEVLREYLFKLAYQVDKQSSKGFTLDMAAVGKSAMRLGAVLIATGAAAATMVQRFASQMDKLYYASQRSNASAANLQAIEYAASRVGIEGGKLTAIMEGLNTAFQIDPGKRGMVEAMGIDTAQDKAAVLVQLMEKLFAMDDIVGARMAQTILGMHESDYLQLKRNRAEFYKYVQEKQKSQGESGVDMDKAAEAGHRFSNAIKTLTDRLGVLKDALSIQLVGPFETFVNAITDGLDRMIRMFGRWGDSSAAFSKAWSGVKRLFSGDVKGGLAEMAAGRQELSDIMSGKTAVAPAKPAAQIVPAGQPSHQPAAQPTAQPTTGAQASQSLQALQHQFKSIPAQVLEFAKAAADKLQVPITNILAQLRAEVGPKFEKFIGQYNYGNIKAGKSWKGETQERTVHEFDKQGNKYYVKDKFRAYKSAAEAGLDYANLLEKSYPKVVGAKSIEQFASGLQSGVGGRMYATDPKYQEKLAATERAIQKQNAVTLQQTNTYHISSPNPQAAASAVGAMHERTNADAVRNLGGVIR